jgi:hypothetical protein
MSPTIVVIGNHFRGMRYPLLQKSSDTCVSRQIDVRLNS